MSNTINKIITKKKRKEKGIRLSKSQSYPHSNILLLSSEYKYSPPIITLNKITPRHNNKEINQNRINKLILVN